MNKVVEDCPFCGCNHLDGYGNHLRVQIACRKCNALGPMCSTQEEAIKAWNKVGSEIRRKFTDRIELALKLNYANFPGYISSALRGETIPASIIRTMEAIVDQENYIAKMHQETIHD